MLRAGHDARSQGSTSREHVCGRVKAYDKVALYLKTLSTAEIL
jgi:hypothetical protein